MASVAGGDLVDPVPDLGNPGVDSGEVFLAAADAPRDDTNLLHAVVAHLVDQRTAAVTLKSMDGCCVKLTV